MKSLLYSSWPTGRRSVGLLAVRLVSGAGLMLHGWPKIAHAFSWMGPDSPVPGFLQACSAAAEFVGGLGLILGLLAPVAALAVMINMIVALAIVHIPHGDPFVGSKPGQHSAESAVVYLAMAFLIVMAGPGKYSLDVLWVGRHGLGHT